MHSAALHWPQCKDVVTMECCRNRTESATPANCFTLNTVQQPAISIAVSDFQRDAKLMVRTCLPSPLAADVISVREPNTRIEPWFPRVQILAGDPTFVRVTKGVYALRTLMGDLPYEAVGRPRKRVRKSRAGELPTSQCHLGNGDFPLPGGEVPC